MSVITKAATAELRHKPGRLAAVVLAIVIGSLFAVATTVFSSTAGRAVEVAVAESLQNADVVVTPDADARQSAVADTKSIEQVAGVAAAAPMLGSAYQVPGGSALSGVRLQSVITDDALAYEKLATGRFPTQPTEIALDPDTAADAEVRVGNEITLKGYDDREATFTITGITDPNPTTRNLSGSVSWVTAEYLAQDPTAWLSSYLVRVDGGADTDQVAATINAQLPGLRAESGAEARAAIVEQVSGGTVAITVMLGTFAAVALVVAAIVIANTFSILLAQRRRQIALQRLVGASATQMRRQILLEALIIGVLGTAVGALAGLGVGYLGARIAGVDAGGFTVDALTVAIACAATITVTVLAAFAPSRRACRIAPIEALRPAESALGGARLPRWRVIVSALIAVAGLAVCALGAAAHSLPVAALGGMVAVIGVLFGAQLIVVAMARILRPLGALVGTPGRIAARDVTRHASRATSTVVAVIVGVGLISMIHVAAQIARASALADAKDSELRKQIEAVIDIMTNVATGLLAVAAVIAVVGIANTLALSVIERSRESGLMRALGVQKGQLRSMISVEAVILALIGAVVGVLLGLMFGAVAAYTAIGGATSLVWDVPWGRLALFLAIAVVGGLVASVLPAIRSGRVSPVRALATE